MQISNAPNLIEFFHVNGGVELGDDKWKKNLPVLIASIVARRLRRTCTTSARVAAGM